MAELGVDCSLFYSGEEQLTDCYWPQFVCQGISFNDCFCIQNFEREKADIRILWLTVKNRPKVDARNTKITGRKDLPKADLQHHTLMMQCATHSHDLLVLIMSLCVYNQRQKTRIRRRILGINDINTDFSDTVQSQFAK